MSAPRSSRRPGRPGGPSRADRLTPRRRSVLVGAGTLCLGLGISGAVLGLGAGPARADAAAPGSALGGYSLMATADGVQFTQDSPTAQSHPQLEGEVPLSEAMLQPGPQGYGLATVAWPGSLVGNGGSTLGLLGAPIPPSLGSSFNDPVRAEVRSGTGPPSVTNSPTPGVSMTASIHGVTVTSESSLAGTTGPAPDTSLGSTVSNATSRLTGASTVEARSSSRVQDIDIGGVIRISSLVSAADARSDASSGHGSGSTTFSGVTVAGFPATIDQTGLHVGPAGTPLGATASQAADQALAGAGMKVFVVQPQLQVQGADVTYTAESLLVYWAPPNSQGNTFTASLGGATASAGASPGFGTGSVLPGATAGGPAASPGATGTAGAGLGAGSAPGLSSGLSSGTSGAAPGAPASGRSGGAGALSTLAADPLAHPLGPGVSWAWVALALLGAGAVALGLFRLPAELLRLTTTACPLGESP